MDISPVFVHPLDNNHLAAGRTGIGSYFVGRAGEGSFHFVNVGALEK